LINDQAIKKYLPNLALQIPKRAKMSVSFGVRKSNNLLIFISSPTILPDFSVTVHFPFRPTNSPFETRKKTI